VCVVQVEKVNAQEGQSTGLVLSALQAMTGAQFQC